MKKQNEINDTLKLLADIQVDDEKFAVLTGNNSLFIFEYLGEIDGDYIPLPVDDYTTSFLLSILQAV